MKPSAVSDTISTSTEITTTPISNFCLSGLSHILRVTSSFDQFPQKGTSGNCGSTTSYKPEALPVMQTTLDH